MMGVRMMSRLSNQVVVITGAASGIGRATAELFAAHGAQVAALDKNGALLREAVDRIEGQGSHAIAFEVDLAEAEQAEDAIAETAKVFGKLDILVNNAATFIARDFFDVTREEWQKVLDVNLTAYFLCARAAARAMRGSAGGGSIVNIASVHQKISEPRSGAYAASKGGVAQLTRNLAIEFAPYNIVVNSISPGFIRTPMSIVDGVDETTTEQFLSTYLKSARIPLRRAGLAEEIAAAALFLAARECGYMTGADLVVDGGLTITL
jgi:NAD(P)-dependent dehydrogenase (short-subunit alcohol dehydrogenase family)